MENVHKILSAIDFILFKTGKFRQNIVINTSQRKHVQCNNFVQHETNNIKYT